MNKKTIYAVILLMLTACSDKGDSFFRVATAPQLKLSKDSLVIREKDYSGYFTGAGDLKIWVADSTSTGLRLSLEEPTGTIKSFYDSVLITRPLAINQYTWVFIAGATPGRYNLRVAVTDQFGKTGEKILPVRIVPNEPPVADFIINTIDQGNGYEVVEIKSVSTSRMSRIVEYTFSVNGTPVTVYKSTFRTTLYTGKNRIELTVKDDLGLASKSKLEERVI